MNAQQNQYLRQVEQWLTDCPIQAKRKLLNGLREEMEEFISQMPDGGYEDLVELFGEPREAAQQLLDAVPLEERQAARKNKWVPIAVVIAILITIIVQMGIILWRELQEPKDGIRVYTYVSQPYFGPDDPIEKGF